MRTEYLATSFFTCGENNSQDYYKIGEAADNDGQVPDSVMVWEPFQDMCAGELMDNIVTLKMLLDRVKEDVTKRHTVQQSEEDLADDLAFYYELDLDNCNMTNKDWVGLLASVMTSQESRNELLREIKDYKDERK